MPDNKYRRDDDKPGWLGIEKYRIIDLLENVQELPETGIYDEPVRYFKANLKWTPIIFGWLTIIQEIAGWQIADDDNHPGIQGIRIFEEGIEPIMEPAQLQGAITEGIYKAVNDIAKQIVTGVRADFTVDAEGNVVPPSEAGAELPEDDPLTVIDEKSAAAAGGALAMAQGVNEFILYVDTLYGPTDGAPLTSLADTQALVKMRFATEVTIDAALLEYYADREALQGQLGVLNALDLAGHFYCDQNTDNPHQSFNLFISLIIGMSVEDRKRYTELVAALAETQFSIWYNKGLNVPSSVYHDFPCEPIPDETIILSVGIEKDTNGIAKKNHRYRIRTEGVLTDPDGDIQDTWYFKAVGESPIFIAGLFNVTSTGFTNDPTAAQVPYRADHRYEWTFERDDNHVLHLLWSANVQMDPASTGLLIVNIHDLGSFV